MTDEPKTDEQVIAEAVFGPNVVIDPAVGTSAQAPVDEVVVDQAMLDENPVLAEAGIEVGDVGRPATEEEVAQLDVEAPAAAEPEAA